MSAFDVTGAASLRQNSLGSDRIQVTMTGVGIEMCPRIHQVGFPHGDTSLMLEVFVYSGEVQLDYQYQFGDGGNEYRADLYYVNPTMVSRLGIIANAGHVQFSTVSDSGVEGEFLARFEEELIPLEGYFSAPDCPRSRDGGQLAYDAF